MRSIVLVFVKVFYFVAFVNADEVPPCNVRARTEYGWVCGLTRWSENGRIYASFRGVPFAKQPVGELRFKELQPPEPWNHDYDAREEGPVCPQHDEYSGYLSSQDYGMSEACIHANIHVPIHALPKHYDDIHYKEPFPWSHEGKKGGKETVYEIPKYDESEYNTDGYTLKKHVGKTEVDPIYAWFGNIKYDTKESIWPKYSQEEDEMRVKNEYQSKHEHIPWLSRENEENKFDDKEKHNDEPGSYEKGYEKRELQDKNNDDVEKKQKKDNYLPILVFIHGGGFNSGSGDAGVLGPEYLVSKGVIVITFNYRINVFGFLTLNTASLPGNNGLRDQITLLRWVQRNAKYFGGDPDDVTLMGQSAGAASAHLLTLSDAAKGLFKRVIIMSGTGYQGFFITSPAYSARLTDNFLKILGITSTDPEDIHDELIKMPLERIVEANSLLQAIYGLISFNPVVETRIPGITTVLDKDPEILIAEGKGNEYPLIIGFVNAETEAFRSIFNYDRYLYRVEANPRLILPGGLQVLPNVSLELGEKVKHRCLGDHPQMDGLVKCYSETYFIYQAFRLARKRASMDAAPTFLYQFSYESDFSAIKEGLRLEYKGAAHAEDLTFAFRVNTLLEPRSSFPPENRDDMMKDWITAFVINFMFCSNPTCHGNDFKSGWPRVTKDHLVYQDFNTPYVFKVTEPTHEQRDMIQFLDKIYKQSGTVQEGNNTRVLTEDKENVQST